MSYPRVNKELSGSLETWPDHVLLGQMAIIRKLEAAGSYTELIDGKNENGYVFRLKREVEKRMAAENFNIQS